MRELIEERKARGETLEQMCSRAAQRGASISTATLSQYGSGKRTAFPDPAMRTALAYALDVSEETIARAAFATAAPGVDLDGRDWSAEHAEAWVRETAGRTPAEIRHALGVVRAVFQGFDEVKQAGTSESPSASTAPTSTDGTSQPLSTADADEDAEGDAEGDGKEDLAT